MRELGLGGQPSGSGLWWNDLRLKHPSGSWGRGGGASTFGFV